MERTSCSTVHAPPGCPRGSSAVNSAIHLARVCAERKRNFVGQHFWVRGNFVSEVGGDEAVLREYSRNQEVEDERLDQLGLWR